jgi:chromosome partitioning protein
VPSNRELAGAEIELVELPERETRLKDSLAEALHQMRSAISEVVPDYDFILLDCPPSLSLLTLNGLCAADSVLIPMQCEYYALEGLSDLVQTIKKVRAHLNPRLEIEGLLRTMYDPRNTLALNVAAELERHFGARLFRTVIPRNVRLAEAPSHGIAVLHFDRTSKGALAYLALAGEMLRRMDARGRNRNGNRNHNRNRNHKGDRNRNEPRINTGSYNENNAVSNTRTNAGINTAATAETTPAATPETKPAPTPAPALNTASSSENAA